MKQPILNRISIWYSSEQQEEIDRLSYSDSYQLETEIRKEIFNLIQTKSFPNGNFPVMINGKKIWIDWGFKKGVANPKKQIILDTSNRASYQNTEQQHYYDYDIIGYGNIHRAKVPHSIKRGDIFNIYLGKSEKNGCEWQGTLDKSLNRHLEILEFQSQNPIIMYQTITVNNVECVIQAYKKGEFVNLCPIHPDISSVCIRFEPFDLGSWGYQNAAWRKYATGINIEELKKQLETIPAINITEEDLAQGKKFKFFTTKYGQHSAEIICPKDLKKPCIIFNGSIETYDTFHQLKIRMNHLTDRYMLHIVKEKWTGEPTLADRIKSLELHRDTRNRTISADNEAYEQTERQIEELKTKYYE